MPSIRATLVPAAVLVLTATAAFADWSLLPVSTYDTGLGANGAEIVSIRKRDGLAAVTNVAGSIDLVDLSNPAAPVLVRRIPVGPATPNSVAIHPQHDYVLVVGGAAGSVGTITAYALDGTLLHAAPAGIQPDSIAISSNGAYAVVANEAEGVATGNTGGEGSVSLVSLEGFNGKLGRTFGVQTIALPSQAGVPGFSTGRNSSTHSG